MNTNAVVREKDAPLVMESFSLPPASPTNVIAPSYTGKHGFGIRGLKMVPQVNHMQILRSHGIHSPRLGLSFLVWEMSAHWLSNPPSRVVMRVKGKPVGMRCAHVRMNLMGKQFSRPDSGALSDRA